MRNEVKIIGDCAIMYLKKLNGEVFETRVDTKNLDKISKLNLSWHTFLNPNTNTYYAKATQTYYDDSGKRKQRTVYLQTVIMDSDYSKGEYVDHLDHDTLNNMEYNLCIKNNTDNVVNRSGINSNNKSGYRNVSWVDGQWLVQLQVNGKNTRIKGFDDVHEAGAFAKIKRKELYNV